VEDYHKCIYTRYYTSPEYLNGFYSKSSDMYSLGVLLYTAFTRNTLDIENINRCNKVTKLPYNIERLIKKLLENNPYDRPSIYDIKSYID
jgi:serine/threonine protein kinase